MFAQQGVSHAMPKTHQVVFQTHVANLLDRWVFVRPPRGDSQGVAGQDGECFPSGSFPPCCIIGAGFVGVPSFNLFCSFWGRGVLSA